jgi:hypothetical protein
MSTTYPRSEPTRLPLPPAPLPPPRTPLRRLPLPPVPLQPLRIPLLRATPEPEPVFELPRPRRGKRWIRVLTSLLIVAFGAAGFAAGYYSAGPVATVWPL